MKSAKSASTLSIYPHVLTQVSQSQQAAACKQAGSQPHNPAKSLAATAFLAALLLTNGIAFGATTAPPKAHLSGTLFEVTIGSNLGEPDQVAVDAAGNVYVADSGNNRVVRETLLNGTWTQTVVEGSFGSVPGGLNDPTGLAVVGTTLYISAWN